MLAVEHVRPLLTPWFYPPLRRNFAGVSGLTEENSATQSSRSTCVDTQTDWPVVVAMQYVRSFSQSCDAATLS